MLATILKGSSPHSNSLEREVANTPDIAVFATTHDVIEACRFARISDVILIDYTVEANVLAIIQVISSVVSPSKIVVANVPDDPIEIVACLESGALGYVRTTETGATMCDVIREAESGQARLDAKVAPALIARLTTLRALQPPETGADTGE